MTEGKIWKEITKFAIPLFLGNLFQQFYNVVDSLVVGSGGSYVVRKPHFPVSGVCAGAVHGRQRYYIEIYRSPG